jgi:hypothetical protein
LKCNEAAYKVVPLARTAPFFSSILISHAGISSS